MALGISSRPLQNRDTCLHRPLKQIVDPVIQRNVFFAHPENIMLSMLTDERRVIRELCIRPITKARKVPSRGIRRFTVPTLNFDATRSPITYCDLIDWTTVTITEPPIMVNVSDEDLRPAVISEQISRTCCTV